MFLLFISVRLVFWRIPVLAALVRLTEVLFEPDVEDLIGYLLRIYLNIFVHVVLLNAKASEQSARMVSMSGATSNAEQMIKDLTLEYNKLRQANITKELLEITTAQMALG